MVEVRGDEVPWPEFRLPRDEIEISLASWGSVFEKEDRWDYQRGRPVFAPMEKLEPALEAFGEVGEVRTWGLDQPQILDDPTLK